ncbi:MAG TPA: LppX_LprAFG lipoprotein [Dehalococcoidia bacterium]|nr:LppX_LprAFG lipoprotein [Dehalococcoidia bacterium]
MRIALLPCLLLIALLLACSGDDDAPDDGSPTATPESAEALLARAATAVENVTSFHFRLTHKNGTTPLPLNLALETAEGDVVIPGRLSAEVEAKAVGSIPVSVDVIAIDDETWITNPFNRRWQRLPGSGLRDFADPEALVRSLVAAVEDPRIDGGSTIDGVRTVKLVASIDAGLLRDALAIARGGNEVQVEAWLGAEDGLPRRIRIIGPLSSSEDDDVSRQIDLSRFDEPVEINPP